MKRLLLHIDRIVVDGLSVAEQRRFSTALEAQLRALFEPGGLHASNGAIRSLSAGTLRPGTTARQAAAQVADSIRQGIIRQDMGARRARADAGSAPGNGKGAQP
jgi:hypothetical protein